MSYKATFSVSQRWPLNTGLTVQRWPLNTGLTVQRWPLNTGLTVHSLKNGGYQNWKKNHGSYL